MMRTRKTLFLVLSLFLALVVAGSALALGGQTTTRVDAAGDPTSTTPTDDGGPSTETPGRRDHQDAPGPDDKTTGEEPTTTTTAPPTHPGTDDGAPGRTPTEPVHEVLPGVGGPPPASPVVPFGELDDDTPIPAAYDYLAPLHEQAEAADFGGPTALAAPPSCSHQCITEGVAYPRGFGAELVVETSVPTSLYLSAIADTDGDGDWDDNHFVNKPAGHTSHSWQLDHLVPGQTYYAMAAATDEYGHTSYAWGEFTTLSQRNVFVELGDATITGGPGGIIGTNWYLGLNGAVNNVSPDEAPILLYNDMPRELDVRFWMFREWHEDICEALFYDFENGAPSGYSEAACRVWNSVTVDGVDLDTIPAGQTRWTQTSTSLLLTPTAAPGDALPADYGTFDFEVPITFHVTYE